MNTEELKHLANLARLDLSVEELEKYSKEMSEILGYVEKISEVAIDDDSGRLENAGVRNVMREDDEPHETGLYTDDLLREAPETKDGFVKVKKILNND